MNKEKQIEEMAIVINDCPFIQAPIGCDKHDGSAEIAKYLYNAGYRKQSEWISVEDRLPEKYNSVLIFCEDEIRVDYINLYGCWYENFLYQVTHWMPLPEAPKMKGGKK